MYCVGIDLGTTNCAIAFADPETRAVTDLEVLQLVRPGEVARRALLPSFVYIPGPELPPELLRLPWRPSHPFAVGELARWQGARVSGRLVSSAKSWLCHPGVDRAAPILPWGSSEELSKISPIEASSILLSHLAESWSVAHPGRPLAEQEVAIAVPASFDEVARALTVEAARRAGIEKLTLLEEPQAAFYDFAGRHSGDLARALDGVRLVLVVDVGGGTTDFTLLHISATPEGPVLRRIAVGDHLMLGGDNMDAALARRAEEKLLQGGRKLGTAQWTQLALAAREAKEALLASAAPERQPLTVASAGSRLLAGVLSTELTASEARQLVLDGFFPRSRATDAPQRAARIALQELGLPYAQDAAITRHLAAFLRAHARAGFAALGQAAVDGALPRLDAVLLNGGVFSSPQIAERLLEVISAWWPAAARIRLLQHGSLDLAVARGAAHYGLVRRGLGLRIGGGAARAFYVGLEAQADRGKEMAVCLIPRGFQEGESIDLGQRSFALTLGRPVQFPLYSTSSDRIDKPGELASITEEFRALPPIHAILEGPQAKSPTLPVHLRATLTEIGTLELWCVSDLSDQRWRLEFELRGRGSTDHLAVVESMPARFGEAREWVERFFGHKPLSIGPRDVKQLGRNLERVLGPKESWRVPVLRELWSALFAGAAKRRRSADHERIFFNLLGYSLRPGFGYPLDDWRCEQSSRAFPQGVQFHAEKSNWNEFWILWRRASGGLSEEAQLSLWSYLKPHLARRVPPNLPQAGGKPKGVQPEGLDEMVRTAASLEHLALGEKAELGEWIAARLQKSPGGGPWAWALGRIGARVPVYGSGHRAIAPERAARWVRLLVDLGIQRIDGAPFAVAQLARRSGDRTRDLDDDVRNLAIDALRGAGAPEAWLRMATEVAVLETADEARALGDTLPAGLQLAT
jgi:molecular chaperone DnaK (HSP70)